MKISIHNTFTPNKYKTLSKNPQKQTVEIPKLLDFPCVEEWVTTLTEEAKPSKLNKFLTKLGIKTKTHNEYRKSPGKLVISKDEHIILKSYLVNLLEDLKKIAQNNRYVQNNNSNNGRLKKDFFTKLYEYGCITDDDLPKLFSAGAGIINHSDFLYFTKRYKKLTPYDNDNILKSRFSTHCKNYTFGGEKLEQKLLQIKNRELENLKSIPQEGKLIVLHGAPGCGKSTLVKAITNGKQNKYYTKEADNIKTELYDNLSEDEGGIIAHKLAKQLLINEIQPKLMEEKRNFIYQATNDLYIERVIKKALKAGYKIDYITVYSPKEINIPRTIERTTRIGRFTDPYDAYLMENLGDTGANILLNYPQINHYVYLSEFGHLSKRI